MEKISKIIVCPKCRGIGKIRNYTDTREGYQDSLCPTCEGQKVIIRVVQIEYLSVNENCQ